MNISYTRPPNFAAIVKVLPKAIGKGTIFTYGNTIYTLTLGALSRPLLEHETVHSKRQFAFLGGPEGWWDAYLSDPTFRFLEELLAHRIEYEAQVKGGNRADRRGALVQIAKRLSGPLYDNAVSLKEAKSLILGELPKGFAREAA